MKKEEQIKADRILECIGDYCPVPILTASREIEKIEINQILEVVNNDPAAIQDIPRWAKCAGHRFLKLFKEGENYHFFIRKGEKDLFKWSKTMNKDNMIR